MERKFLDKINPFRNRKDNDISVSIMDIQEIAYKYHIDATRLFLPSTRDFARIHQALDSWWSWRAGEDYQKQGRGGITIFGTEEYGKILEQSLNSELGPQIPIIFLKSNRVYYKKRVGDFTPFAVNEVEGIDGDIGSWGISTRISVSELAFRSDKWLVRNDVGPLNGVSNCFYMDHLLRNFSVVADRVSLRNAFLDARKSQKPFWLSNEY